MPAHAAEYPHVIGSNATYNNGLPLPRVDHLDWMGVAWTPCVVFVNATRCNGDTKCRDYSSDQS